VILSSTGPRSTGPVLVDGHDRDAWLAEVEGHGLPPDLWWQAAEKLYAALGHRVALAERRGWTAPPLAELAARATKARETLSSEPARAQYTSAIKLAETYWSLEALDWLRGRAAIETAQPDPAPPAAAPSAGRRSYLDNPAWRAIMVACDEYARAADHKVYAPELLRWAKREWPGDGRLTNMGEDGRAFREDRGAWQKAKATSAAAPGRALAAE
jgi:hypothetical protein